MEWVESVVKRLVDHPEKVEARWLETEKTVEINVLPDDRGKVIGRRGKTIDSLRILATAVFAGPNERIDVKLREE
ncbi:MAG: KH domain-containing protein [Elusimicrobia bacterium]|nr:KH domain-containing protein [Elusimicrobiota bacterium]